MNKRRWIALLVAFNIAFCGVSLYEVHAKKDYDSAIASINKEKQKIQKKNNALNKAIEDLEKNKDDILKYIKKMDIKANEVTEEMEKLAKDISALERKLVVRKSELEKAEKEEKEHYETMKKRIKYMYENGNSEYVDIIFNSKDISDMLNRTEYINKITDYDSKMIVRYRENREKIESEEKDVEGRVDELSMKKDDLRAKKAALKKLTDNKNQELKKYEKNLRATRAQRRKYLNQVAVQEAKVETLLRKKQAETEKKERAARRAAAANNSSSSNHSSDSDNSTDEENDTNTEPVNPDSPINDPFQNGATQFRWPLKIKARISSKFGARKAPTAGASTYHKGIDISCKTGTPIVAANTGTVVTATYSSSAGNFVMIYHGNSIYTVYMHCSKLNVKAGDSVIKGQTIALAGSTGISTASHLHFGVSVKGVYVNPLKYVKQ